MLIAIPVSPEGGKDSPGYYMLNVAYSRYVANAGYTPVLVTMEHNIVEIAKKCDGLLLPGGKDVDPMFYSEDNDSSYNVDPTKDDLERRLFYAFAELGKPVFGICRGFQLIFLEYCRVHPKLTNARFLYTQHIGSHNQSSSNLAARGTPSHQVSGMKYLLYGNKDKDLNGTLMPVNSMHHQACLIKIMADRSVEITKQFTLLAWTVRGADSFKNYVVAEAFSIYGWLAGRILAVQWHPEELNDVQLLKSFFEKKDEKVVLNVAAGLPV